MKLWPKFIDRKYVWELWLPVLIMLLTQAFLYAMGVRYGLE